MATTDAEPMPDPAPREPDDPADPVDSFTGSAQEAFQRAEPGAYAADLRRLLKAAKSCAFDAGSSQVDTQHLLIALFRVDLGEAPEALRRLNLDLDAVMRAMLPYLPQAPASMPVRELPYSFLSKQALAAARDEARAAGRAQADALDLLAALAGDGDGMASLVLQRMGIGAEGVRAARTADPAARPATAAAATTTPAVEGHPLAGPIMLGLLALLILLAALAAIFCG